MSVNIEALVELKGAKADTEEVAKRIRAENGLAAIIGNNGKSNMNGRGTYTIVLRGTSESEEKAERLLYGIRKMLIGYSKNGNYAAIVASSVDEIAPETHARAPAPPPYSRDKRSRRPNPHYQRGRAR